MSEYQYYEFLAIDRPLTDEQMAELRSISSRAEITPTHFSNEYNYGDLKADPHTLLKRYFDAHVYVANWGTHRLSLRFPAELVEVDDLKRYCLSEQTSVEKTRDIVVLDIYSETEDYEGWVEGAGWMASLAPVREEILRGDLRGLYLAWLLAVQNEELDPDDTEPNVPPGLGKLSAPLQSLSQFLRLDEHLMTAAAEEDVHAGRTVGALLERSEVLRDAHAAEQTRRAERDRRRRDKAAAVARAKRLDDLAKRQAAAWKDVEKLVSSKKPKAYDEAVSLLKDLHDLGDRDNETEAFASRLTSLRDRHTRKPSFIARLERWRRHGLGGS